MWKKEIKKTLFQEATHLTSTCSMSFVVQFSDAIDTTLVTETKLVLLVSRSI